MVHMEQCISMESCVYDISSCEIIVLHNIFDSRHSTFICGMKSFWFWMSVKNRNKRVNVWIDGV